MALEKEFNRDAFDIPLVSQKKSSFRCYFREELPNSRFRVSTKINGLVTEYEDNADATDYAFVEGGQLIIKAPPNLGDITYVHSREHPQFHPDNGKRFASSIFYDTFSTGDHEYGFINADDDTLDLQDVISMRVIAGQFYGRIMSNGIDKDWYDEQGQVDEDAKIVPQSRLDPLNLDPSKGHLVDIIAQLRNVGNIHFGLSGKTSEKPKEVLQFNGLNNQSTPTVSNPALHGGFIVRNNGVRSQMRIGCLDMSNETQDDDLLDPVTFSNVGSVSCDTAGEVIAALFFPHTYLGKLNTRDVQYFKSSIYSDKRAKVKLYRTFPNRIEKNDGIGGSTPLVDTDWTNIPGSSIKYIDNSVDLPSQPGIRINSFDITNLIAFDGTGYADAGEKELLLPSPNKVPLKFVHGEVIVVFGIGITAAAAMSVDSLLLGESI